MKKKTPGQKTDPQVKRQTPHQEGTSDDTTQSAGWINVLEEEPIWYKNLTIRTPAGEILEGWARVSNGDNDYYVCVDPNVNTIIPTITHWQYINQHKSC